MSRKIDFNKKLSAEDREFLLGNGRTAEVDKNDAEHGVDSSNPTMTREQRDERIAALRSELAMLEHLNAVEDNPNLAQGGLAGIVGGVKDNTVVDGEVPVGAPVEQGDNYETMTVSRLKEELAARNKERFEAELTELSLNGTKAELVERLRQDDREAADGPDEN